MSPTTQKLGRLGALALVAFPLLMILGFSLHFVGEFTPADFLRLRLVYEQPSPARFLEIFQSDDLLAFLLPHLIIYLALPLMVPAAVYLGFLLFARKGWLAVLGVGMSVAGTVFMGGVFGSWLSFTAVGSVPANAAAATLPAVAALIRHGGMLALTSALAALSLVGMMALSAGLFWTRAIPRLQAALLFVAPAMIIAFMDIDNLMLLASLVWVAGALPLLLREWSSVPLAARVA